MDNQAAVRSVATDARAAAEHARCSGTYDAEALVRTCAQWTALRRVIVAHCPFAADAMMRARWHIAVAALQSEFDVTVELAHDPHPLITRVDGVLHLGNHHAMWYVLPRGVSENDIMQYAGECQEPMVLRLAMPLACACIAQRLYEPTTVWCTDLNIGTTVTRYVESVAAGGRLHIVAHRREHGLGRSGAWGLAHSAFWDAVGVATHRGSTITWGVSTTARGATPLLLEMREYPLMLHWHVRMYGVADTCAMYAHSLRSDIGPHVVFEYAGSKLV